MIVPSIFLQDHSVKHEAVVQGAKAVVAIGGTGLTLWLQQVSLVVSIIVGLATASYVIVQCAFLIRKWFLLEHKAKPPTWEGG